MRDSGRRQTTHFLAFGLLLLFVFSFALSCTSRFRTQLYCIKNHKRFEASVEEAFYVRGYGVKAELSDDFLVAANGQLGAVAFYVRDTLLIPHDPHRVVQYRPRRNYRLFWPLPNSLSRGSLRVPGLRPFVRDIDRYEAPLSERVYLFTRGDLQVDSIKSSDLYTSIAATFHNQSGDSLRFEGQIKIRPRKKFRFSRTRSIRTP